MSKESILYGVIGLLIGAILAGAGAAYAVNNNQQSMMNMMGMHSNTNSRGMMDDSDMSMNDMTSSLKNKTGDDFDEAFISGMIAHHQGAIDMANLAKQNAKHSEIKNLANDIVTAQTKEINEMNSWQAKWGYDSSGSTNSSHSMDMMGH
ncbi:MAG TPA: DUF305 domain-containing protein [Candidatus Saccharibacteria bacterium]|nr:DUF305 domain-containing protein [Candidatus Saccharibacteria bacterium]HRK94582.1 DUF305 domain-containing protein [Candidatus Saccharibacteria bacterium]